MAITNFKLWLAEFLRRNGEGDLTFTSSYPTDATTKEQAAYDYYQLSGQYLLRVLLRYTKNEIDTVAPYFIGSFSSNLTGGSVALPADYDKLYIQSVTSTVSSIVWKTNKCPVDKFDWYATSGHRRSASLYNRYYALKDDNKIYVLPATATAVKFRYIKTVPRVTFATTDDIWSGNFTGILVDGALMLAKGDSNNLQIEQFFMQKLMIYAKTIQIPISKKNETLTEQE